MRATLTVVSGRAIRFRVRLLDVAEDPPPAGHEVVNYRNGADDAAEALLEACDAAEQMFMRRLMLEM